MTGPGCECSRLPPRWWQTALLPGLLLLAIAAAAWGGEDGRLLLGLTCAAGGGLVAGGKILAVLAGTLRRHHAVCSDPPLAEDDPDLPVYTVLVPLYHEAGVVAGLLAALDGLRYPRDRLQILILLESNDAATADAFAGRRLPTGVELLVVPPGVPRTKPRACNAGLAQARGGLVVVYDAEDRPDPDQLLRAAAAFRRLPAQIACLQARLNVWNRSDSLTTRGFTIEYSTWFDLVLPGLHAVGAPIPLGGTSNHFRAGPLHRLGWDPWNVTEDCDLGLRLARNGLGTAILDSTTWEEAPISWGAWIRQRSRWMKGYWQTFLVHTREPLTCLRELGWWRSGWMLGIVGGQVLALLVMPLALLLAAAWLWWRWPLFDPNRPWTLVAVVAAAALALGNVFFLVIHAVAAWQRGFRSLASWTPLMPLYWLLAGLATWRGVWQAFRDPFAWEKTTHGLSLPPLRAPAPLQAETMAVPAAALVPPARRRPLLAALLLALLAGLAWTAAALPRWLRLDEEVAFAAIPHDASPLAAEVAVEAAWTANEHLAIEVAVDGSPPGAVPVRAIVHLKTLDGAWFQRSERLRLVDGLGALALPLGDGWTPRDPRQAWSRDQLRRVRAVGLRVFAQAGVAGPLRLTAVRAAGTAPQPPLAVTGLRLPAELRQQAMGEFRFDLSRCYANPFAPAEIDLWGEFRAPDGTTQCIPAFHTQDYARRLEAGREVLEPLGTPCWAVRWRPAAPGVHSFRLVGHDRSDALAEPWRNLVVAASRLPGAVRIANDGRHFEHENGTFRYPLGLNLRSPHDTLVEDMPGVRQPADAEGTFVYDRWFTRMAAQRLDFARLWLAPGFLGLEWSRAWPGYHGLGVYNLQNAWRLDRLIGEARRRGILIELALWQHGPFTERYDSQWADNPYNVRNGGPLAGPAAAMRDPATRAGFRDLLRYLAARYGADPGLFGWTLWIECDSVSKDGLAAWHAEMAAHLRSLDPGRHPISAEFITATGEAEVWALPGIDYTQLPGYCGGDLVRIFLERTATLQPFAKPALIEEYGGDPVPGGVRRTAHLIHDGLWAGWCLPLAGAPMAWYWQLVFDRGLERHYRRFAEFIAGADLRGVAWAHRRLPIVGDDRLSALVRGSPDRAWVWIHAAEPARLPAVADYWAQGRCEPARVTGFDPLAAEPGSLFDGRSDRHLQLDQLGLAPGRYRLEAWDTWSDAAPIVAEAVVAPGAIWQLPPIIRDTALRFTALP